MRNRNKPKIVIFVSTLLVAMLALTGCYNNDEYTDRKEQQETVTLENSLEIANLQKRLELQNDPDQVGYVYVMSFAQIIGYYVIKGKVSSSGSQLAPEQEVIRYYGEPNILDSAQDDGTYGTGDPGNFFFLADGTYVEITLDYIYSTVPINVDVPRLGG